MKDSELFDQTEFRKALELYERQSSKDFVQVIEKVAIDASFKSIKHTPRMQTQLLNKWNPRPGNRTREGRVLYALSAKDGWRRGQGIAAEANRRYIKKRKAGGYLKMMFLNAAKDLGAPVRRKTASDRSAAGKTRATRANTLRLYVDIITGALESGETAIIEPAFGAALMESARSIRAFAEKRMAATAAKYSA